MHRNKSKSRWDVLADSLLAQLKISRARQRRLASEDHALAAEIQRNRLQSKSGSRKGDLAQHPSF